MCACVRVCLCACVRACVCVVRVCACVARSNIISLTSSNHYVTHMASYIIFYFISRDAHCKCVCPSTVPATALCGGGCVSLCQESRWTVHPLRCYHVYYLQECDMSVPRGMGTKRGVMSSPPDLPLVRVAGICLIFSPQQLGDPSP